MEDEGSLEDDEAEEYIDDMKLDEARAEERDEDWQEREFAKCTRFRKSIAESTSFQLTASKRRKKKKKAKEPVMKDRGQLKQFQALPLDLVGEVSVQKTLASETTLLASPLPLRSAPISLLWIS